MIAVLYNGYYSANKKIDRQRINKDLTKILTNQGMKLEPISYATVKHFAGHGNRNEIYKVHDLKTKFRTDLDQVPADITYFASWMSGGYGSSRIRKYAVLDMHNGDQYVIYQESAVYSYRISIINTKTLKREVFNNTEEIVGYLMIQDADIEALPLLMNLRGNRLKKMVKDRLCLA